MKKNLNSYKQLQDSEVLPKFFNNLELSHNMIEVSYIQLKIRTF